MSNSLLIGPLPPILNGQSKCFQIVATSDLHSVVVDRNVTQYKSLPKIIKYARALIKSLRYLLTSDIRTVYISISRNFLGMCFDAVVILLGALLRKDVILHLHGHDFLVNKRYRAIFSKSHSYCTKFIVLTQPMKERIENLLTCEVEVIINPIDNLMFEHESLHDHDQINIIYLSHLTKYKGVMDFVEIAREMIDYPEYKFHIVGELMSDQLSSANELENELNIALEELSNLHYQGSLYGEQLAMYLEQMDILIFPTFYPVEALPLSVLECAAMGIYPIINRHNDLEEFESLLEHVSMTNTKNYQGVKELIKSFTKAQLREFGSANRTRCEGYTVQQHLSRIWGLLNQDYKNIPVN